MTTESGSDSESKQDREQEPQEGAGAGQPPPAQNQQPDGEPFPAAAAHSTPVRKEQNGDGDAEAAPLGKHEYQQFEDDKASQKSSSSKLSKSPLKSVKKPKNMQCKVTLLDGSDYTCVVEKRSRGQMLFDKVCEQLNLLEKDYFGMTFRDMENQKNWLDPAKEIKKQIRSGPWNFAFNVKFYPPDPSQLSEDITRYYLCLQLRDDVVSGRLPCSFATHTLLGSYTVQSELGDYDPEEYGTEYVSEFRFAPNQTKELEEKVMDLHKNYKGMTPAEAEMHFLENAKKLSMYGVDLHHAKDSEGVDIMLGVCASGLLIYRDRLRINRFAWPKVLKISYKRNNFYIKIRPGEFEQFESTIGFKLPNHRAAKRLWKVCVEHHTFFRLVSPEAPPKKFLTLGSKFRYSGRTQAQTRRASSQIVRPAPYFERSSSKRYTMSRSLDGASVSETHEIFMKNSMSASEVGTAQYGTAKGIATGDLITTVTPEKKAEEEKAEEEQEQQQQQEEEEEQEEQEAKETPAEPTPVTPIRHDAKTDSEQTDTAADGETTATEETITAQEELVKHQTNISELKRTFLETTSDSAGLTEWEKRLSTSPVRTSPRLEDAPMIEPLVPEEVMQRRAKIPIEIPLPNTPHITAIRAEDKMPPKVAAGEKKNIVTYKVMAVTSTLPGEKSAGEFKTLEDLRSDMRSKEEESSETKVERESFASTLKQDFLQQEQAVTKTLTEEKFAKVYKSEFSEKFDGCLCRFQQPLVVKTEPVSFITSTLEERGEIATKDVPVIHTETKTITYESSQGDTAGDAEPGVLMSAQTITSETTSTTTTTHITKTVKGGISETRIEKRIVITGDADIDHDQALAQAIKEAKEQHPDMSVTKVVVHKETEITPEDGEE
uniref:Erythrocyte membrane protein band 4.1-like 3a n=1 Tax=Lepisosteus oculatus TaxID=7918 RepID=W5M5I3_LEPOC